MRFVKIEKKNWVGKGSKWKADTKIQTEKKQQQQTKNKYSPIYYYSSKVSALYSRANDAKAYTQWLFDSVRVSFDSLLFGWWI